MNRISVCRTLSVIFLAGAAAGCAGLPPAYSDPFAGGDAKHADSPYSGLVLGFVPTPNTVQTTQYVHDYPVGAVHDALASFYDLFSKDFRSVVKAATPAEAAAQGADLIAMMDLKMVLPLGPFKSTADAVVRFQTPDGAPIDELSGHGKHSAPFWPGKHQSAFALEDAAAALLNGLQNSEKLRAYAKERAGKPAAVGVAAAPRPAKSSAADRPSYQLPPSEDSFALVVGIEKYASLPAADYAERDADAVRRHLLALGFPERNVIALTGASATKTGIEKYVESWLPRNVRPQSRVFVYFSGHGAPDPASGEAFLVPWDGDPKFLDTTGYPLARLYQKLGALKARQVVVAMDSCFSGAGGRSVLAKGARPLVNKVDLRGRGLDGVVVLAAAGGDEITGSAEDEGHGLFTYQLLKALNDSGGKASVAALFSALKPAVQDAARRDNRDQNPQLLPPSAADDPGLSLR